MILLLAFLLVPLVEIALFIQVGGLLGLWPTLLIVIFTAVLGASRVRRQGAGVLQRVQSSFNQFQDPSQPLAEGAMILFSGALLLTPGFFTDAIGFALLVPAVRRFVFEKVKERVIIRQTGPQTGRHAGSSAQPHGRDDIIEGDFEVQEPPSSGAPGQSGWTRH